MEIIRDDEHVFIPGMTGSGKTFLAQNYLLGVKKRIYILDTKATFEWAQVSEKDKIVITHLRDIETLNTNVKKIIYRPAREELNESFYNSFFEYCYFSKNCTVCIDEVMQVCPSPARIPEFYKGILTRGRELNVNVWSLTQRPATIPVVVYSEATHWFIFKLNSADDRNRLSKFTGYDEFMEIIPKRVFLYYNANSAKPPQKGQFVIK